MYNHFDGKHFHNEPGSPKLPNLQKALRWNMNREGPKWPVMLPVAPGPRPPKRVEAGQLRITFVGHSTVLVQHDGINILLDPVWSDKMGPFSWLGFPRHRAPGIRFADLPPIDAVLVSHDHYDHLDLPTLKRLDQANSGLKIVVPRRVGRWFARSGIKAETIELDLWQDASVGVLKVTATPAVHWSGRLPWAQNGTLWAGFFIAGSSRIFYAGDTGWGSQFKTVREKLGQPHVAILPIGSYKPRWFMSAQHIDPAEAVQAARELGARYSIPVHYGTFHSADDGPTEALEELARQLDADDAPEFVVLKEGEGKFFE